MKKVLLSSIMLHFLLLLSVFASVFCFPSITLNEKNKEVSWEAWLLVDDQNQNRQVQQDGQVPRRRITAKSVFVAPTFSPESLPPCADGYNSDSLGRCVKIIKLDEDKHLDFLVSKLNEKFGSSLDYESTLEIDEANSQPTKLDIPFITDYEDYYSNDTPQEELDMAIIVTPTTRESEKTKFGDGDSSKVGKRDNVYEQELKGLVTVKNNEETTTVVTTESTTTGTVSELDSSTIATTTTTMEQEQEQEEISTISTIKDEAPELTTSTIETTTTTTTTTTSTTPKITTYHPIATTYHPYYDLIKTNSKTIRNLIKFPDEDGAMPRSHPSFVRFPDVDYKHHQESLVHRTRDVDEQSGNFFNEIVTPQPSQKIHETILSPPRGYFSNSNMQRQISATTERHLIKRPFVLPPKWSYEEQQRHHKPIVLRFSRKHFNLDTNKFKNSEFYRSLPMDDLTYLFGYKNGQTSHR